MASVSKMRSKRYYVRSSIVPFEEDMCHEFKGHRNICVEDLPPWTKETKFEKASRKAISRTLNAFLNTGKGGTCYLGIVDNGSVSGLPLTQYQKDHIMASVDDLMSRYDPPVKQHRYKIRYVPILESDSVEELELFQREQYEVPESDRKRPHRLRNYEYCWCDSDNKAKFACGVISQDYVIEIVMKPWDPHDPRNKTDGYGSLVKLQPFHKDEEGNIYFRRQASLVKYSMQEMAQLTRQEVKEQCEMEIQRLKDEVEQLKKEKLLKS